MDQEPLAFETQSLVNECSLLQSFLDSNDAQEAFAILRPLHHELPSQSKGIRDSQPRLRPYWRYFVQSGYTVNHQRLLNKDSTLRADIIKFNGPCIEKLLKRLTGVYQFSSSGQLELFQFVPLTNATFRRLARDQSFEAQVFEGRAAEERAVAQSVIAGSKSGKQKEAIEDWGNLSRLIDEFEKLLGGDRISELGTSEDVWNIVHQANFLNHLDLKANQEYAVSVDGLVQAQVLLRGLPLPLEFCEVATRPVKSLL